MNERFFPYPSQPITNSDEFWRERRAISACLRTAGIYGEEAATIERETLIALGICKPFPCE